MIWPPTLDDLKSDMRITDARDDVRLQDMLDAALAFVAGVHDVASGGTYNVMDDPFSSAPPPDADMALGTVRLAARWHTRGRSPDGLVNAGDLGTTRVTTFDADIDRQLKIGRHALPVIA